MLNKNNPKEKGRETRFPLIRIVQQDIKTPRIVDLEGEIRHQLDKFALKNLIKPKDTVAITAGSRGISNHSVILRAVVDYLKELGSLPFIFPAMGSHGGGTREGQLQILAD